MPDRCGAFYTGFYAHYGSFTNPGTDETIDLKFHIPLIISCKIVIFMHLIG